MPAYAVIFGLEKDNPATDYKTLQGAIANFGEGISFGEFGACVPYLICFHSHLDLTSVAARVQEHLHSADTVAILELKGGILASHDPEALRQFQIVMSNA